MTAFTIAIDDEQVLAALARLRRRTDNLGPVLKAIGEDLVESTKQRFATGAGPDGTPWAANSAVTISRYLGLTKGNYKKDGELSKKGATRLGAKKPLTGETLSLGSQIRYQVRGNVLEVGSSMEYAAMQQFGGTKAQFPNLWGDIPARPFLGLSAADKAAIDETIAEYLDLLK